MILLNGISVNYPDVMTEAEATHYATEEMNLWNEQGKQLDRICIDFEDEMVRIQGFEKSPIRRIRRITGYLSEADNFNDAKRAELKSRVVHFQ